MVQSGPLLVVIKAFLRAYQPLVSITKALLNPYFWGGTLEDRSISHDISRGP